MRRAVRIAIVCAIGVFEIGCCIVALTKWNVQIGEFGWNVGTDGETVIRVEPNRPAARAGIEAGDRVVYSTMPALGRIDALLNQGPLPGTTVTFEILHRGTPRTVTISAQEVSSLNTAFGNADVLGGLALGVVGLALVLMRPSRMTWAFMLVALPLVIPNAVRLWANQAEVQVAASFQAALGVLGGLQGAGVLAFASRFPSDVPKGFSRLIDAFAIPFGIVVTAIAFYVTLAIFALPQPPQPWALSAHDFGMPAFAAVCALAAFIATYAAAVRDERSRLAPVIAAFAILVLVDVLSQFGIQVTSNSAFFVVSNFLFLVAAFFVAATVAYGVIRHRVIDVDFIISRTLAYTILTIFVVALFALIEYVVGKLLEAGQLAQILEIAAAVAVGVSMNYLHNWLDRTLDVVIFRRRHLAELRLDRAARTLPHAASTTFVAEMMVDEPSDALDLASAAFFHRNGARFVRLASRGWNDANAKSLDEDDQLIARLRAELHAVSLADVRWPRTDLPIGIHQPLYAIPVTIAHRLEGIALYGGHVRGEALDPDERKSLRELAGGAALALDHLVVEDLRRRLDEMEVENETLRRLEERLSGLLQDRLRPTN